MNVEVHITKTAFGGDGVGHLNGKICFVEGALAGERVIARVIQDKKNLVRAVTVQVLESSPFRVEPPCPYVGSCGGCQYQHVSYPEELRIKESQVRETLNHALRERAGDMDPIRYADKELGYRNSVTLHRTIEPPTRFQRLGYIKRDNTSKLVVDECLIADKRFLPVFTERTDLGPRTDKVTFRLNEKGRIISDQKSLFYRVKVGQEELLAGSQGFFQNNTAVTELLCKTVASWVRKLKPQFFFDLYSGVGTFTFLAAKGVPHAICIEENLASLEALRMNIAERGLKNVRVIRGLAEKTFPAEFLKDPVDQAVVCLDPPRQGIERELAEFLGQALALDGIIYISCDPLTLARDLKIILEQGHFRVQKVAPFDMFPRTKHIETAVLLTSAHAT